MEPAIPLRWIKNDVESARKVFGPGRVCGDCDGTGGDHDLPCATCGGTGEPSGLTYLGAPILADFELSYEALAPYVCRVLDLAAPLEGAGLSVKLVEIEGGSVRVW